MILLKFIPLYDNTDIDKLDSYLNGCSFCFFATRMFGGAEGYDYAFHLECDTEQQSNLQLGLILNKFGNLIEFHQVKKGDYSRARLPMYNIKTIRTVLTGYTLDKRLNRLRHHHLLSRSITSSTPRKLRQRLPHQRHRSRNSTRSQGGKRDASSLHIYILRQKYGHRPRMGHSLIIRYRHNTIPKQQSRSLSCRVSHGAVGLCRYHKQDHGGEDVTPR